MRTETCRSSQRGITLIELLTVVAIVAILGTIALSSYRGSVIRANRAEGTATLLRVQAAQEKYLLSAQEYTNNLAQLGINASTERDLYGIKVVLTDTGGYTVTATAKNGQTADTECDTLTIDETGKRTPNPATTQCWR